MKNILILRSFVLAMLSLLGTLALAAPAFANNIQIGSCVEFDTCYFSSTPTSFSKNLSLSDLTGLGLGSTQSLFVVQTSPFIIRLGQTTLDFLTLSGSVKQMLAEFNGPVTITSQAFTVGSFFIPMDALSVTVSGTFGNSTVSNSAGANVFLGVSPVPLPPALPMFGAALLVLAGFGVLRRRGVVAQAT